MRPDYCPMVNEPCQSMCDTPCSVNRLATQRIPRAVTQIPQEHSSKQEQRKPLTDEEILADETLRYYFGLNGGAGPVSKQGRRIVNAIEAAHGIYAPTERKGEA